MKNKYNFSVIHFVPDPFRGEFVNIGALVGSDELLEWHLRLIDNPKRARAIDEKGILFQVWDYVINIIGRQIDDYTESIENDTTSEFEINESWLNNLWEENQNIVQFSRPSILLADNVYDALELVFDQFIIDKPKPESARFRTRRPAVVAIKTAYKNASIGGENLKERVLITGNYHLELFDFAIVKEGALQLSHAFSFQLPDKEELSKNVRAWSWTVQDLRSRGGALKINSHDIEIPKNIDIEVAIISPTQENDDRVLKEATTAFEKNNVNWVELDNAVDIANKASKLLLNVNGGLQH